MSSASTRSFAQAYGDESARIEIVPSPLKEANFLKLDIAKSTMLLGWRPRLGFERTIGLTAEWYRGFHRDGSAGKRPRDAADRSLSRA